MLEYLKTLNRDMNTNGFAIPLARDPKTGQASLSMTLTIISFCIAAAGEVGKLAHFMQGVDLQQANYLFCASAALYYARGSIKTDGKTITVTPTDKDNQ